MIPQKLTLKKFIGIRSGLNRDEISIDLESILEESHLVAIVGKNGTGKTTIMDNLHPYRIMPSRANGYSSGSFSFYDNTYDEAFKELEFSHEGKEYRSTLIIKGQNKAKSTQAYLLLKNNEEWTPVCTSDGITSDGKTVTYDKCIEYVLGTSEMFFTSAFSSQGKSPLSAYSNSDIKSLMSELLGLDEIRNLGEQSKDVNKGIQTALNNIQNELASITSRESELSEDLVILESSEKNIQEAENSRTDARQAVQDATAKLSDIQADNSANLEVEATRRELGRIIKETDQEATRKENQSITTARQYEERQKELEKRIISEKTNRDSSIQNFQDSINDQSAILALAETIESERQRLIDLKNEAESLQAQLKKEEDTASDTHQLKLDQAKSKQQLQEIKNQGVSAKNNLDALQEQSKLIISVPCHGTELQGKCTLLTHAMTASEQLSECQNQVKILRENYAASKTALDELTIKINSNNNEVVIADIKKILKTNQDSTIECNKTIAMSSSVKNAQETIDMLKKQIDVTKNSYEEHKKEVEQDLHNLKEEKSLVIDEIIAEKQSLIDKKEKLTVELNDMPEPSDTSAIDQAQQTMEQADRELSESENLVANLKSSTAIVQARINETKRFLATAEPTKITAKNLETEIAYWTQLSTALGNNGIIALSIDDAGPTLASLANDLLLSAYGPRFTVSIKTQAEKADGSMKETFDVSVFDAESDDEKSVSIMSGGEKIYINEALSRAIALYQAEASNRKYGCLFADESDGALDPEKKQQFIQMKRKMLELGGYSNEIFISHTPELWDMADCVIDMNDYIRD